MIMKKVFVLITVYIFAVLFSRANYTSDVQMYIANYQAAALWSEQKYGVPAAITLAQGILESGCGKSGLTQRSNNHFGIKGVGPAGSVKAKDDEPGLSTFKAYHNATESYEDHARLLSRSSSRYGWLHGFSKYDYRSWAYGIKKSGYATAPDYAESLIGIIEAFRLYDINHGKKLKANVRVVVKKVRRWVPDKPGDANHPTADSIPEFENEASITLADDQISDEERELEDAIKDYPNDIMINGVPCAVKLPGKTVGTICRDYGLKDKNQILRFNEVESEADIPVGGIVFLDKKKDCYEEARDYYFVHKDETLYSISQKFGIKVKKLAKLNGIKDIKAPLRVGERIELK